MIAAAQREWRRQEGRESSPEAEVGDAAVGAAAGQVEPNGLLAFAERVGEAAKSYERGSSVAAAGRAIRAELHGAVVVTERIRVPTLLVALVPSVGHVLEAGAAPQ
jgi:hypothetical protein